MYIYIYIYIYVYISGAGVLQVYGSYGQCVSGDFDVGRLLLMERGWSLLLILLYMCVLILILPYMCPHLSSSWSAAGLFSSYCYVYVSSSSYCYIYVSSSLLLLERGWSLLLILLCICVLILILLYICVLISPPLGARLVSSLSISLLILIYMYISSYYYICVSSIYPHTTLYVSSYMCPHTNIYIYISSYY